MNSNRSGVITGAAGRMGALLVARFLSNGDTVIATDSSDEALAKLVSSSGLDTKLHVLSADISDATSCAALAGFARDKAGRVDVPVNCAGFFPTQSFDATRPGRDLVGTVFFLVSPDADFMTGQTLNVDKHML